MGRQTGRRAFLSTVVTGSVAALAGCGGDSGSQDGTEDSTGSSESTEGPSIGGSYPMFGANETRNGYVSATGPEDPEQLWQVEYDSQFINSPIVADSTVFQTSNEESVVYAVSAVDGSERWQYDTEGQSLRGEPAVANGTLFVGDYRGKVHAIDAQSGTEEWVYDVGSSEYRTFSGPAVTADTLYVGLSTRGDAKYAALNIDDGTEKWVVESSGFKVSAPVVGDGTVFFEDERALRAFDATDGSEEWDQNVGISESDRSPLRRPVYHDGVLYTGSKEPYQDEVGAAVYAIDATDGSLLWETPIDTSIHQPAVEGDSVYVADQNSKVLSLATDDGSVQWEVDADASGYSPTLTEDSLLLGDGSGGLTALDRTDGSEQWRFDIRGGVGEPVALVDGTVYISTWLGVVYAIA